MKLSVGVPCYAQSEFLPGLIASLAELPCVEILIVDDGNPEPLQLPGRDDRVRVVRHPRNLGIAASRNTLIREAVGELILFLDADAELTGAPASWISRFRAEERLAAVTGRGFEDGSGGAANRWRRWFWPQDHGPSAVRVPFAYGICCVWRRAVLLELGGFDSSHRTHGEDIDLSFRATGAGWVIRHEPELTVLHRRRDSLASLLTMIWNHSFYFSAVCRRHHHPLYRRALVNAVKWLPITIASSVIRHRDLPMALISVPAGAVSIAGRLAAPFSAAARTRG